MLVTPGHEELLLGVGVLLWGCGGVCEGDRVAGAALVQSKVRWRNCGGKPDLGVKLSGGFEGW